MVVSVLCNFTKQNETLKIVVLLCTYLITIFLFIAGKLFKSNYFLEYSLAAVN